nr:helix-hairpin-helix domain-containing protein [Chryseobacterium soli]
MMKKSYYQKLALMGLLPIALLIFQQFTSKDKGDFSDVKFITEAKIPLDLTEFDPNVLDEHQWQKLGFTEKQISTILNYKKIVGGKFTSKEQLKKCYAISSDQFKVLESYILLPENGGVSSGASFKSFEKRQLTISRKFNPDELSVDDWMAMGLSEKQSQAILKYKNYLGGSFISKEKFKDCFIISTENYKKLEPYLLLPAKTPENYKSFSKNYNIKQQKIQYHSFDPNSLDASGWQSLGFSEKQAQSIVNYRDRILKGSFKNPEDLQKCFMISAEKFEELKPYIKIIPSIATAAKKTEPKQETDFSKINLNAITFKQLVEFGLDEKGAASILGFRKKLGGFINKQQILDTYNIDKEIVGKLISTCQLDNSGVARYTLVTAPEEWLKEHPYFKYSADKIIFYRTTYPDDRKILKLLKLKPEYEERMKLYLK